MLRLLVLALPVVLWAWGSLLADTIVLKTGERIQGEVVEEAAGEVSVRRNFRDTQIRYVEKIPREQIARIERSAMPSSPTPAPKADARPPDSDPAPSTIQIEDKPAFLDEAMTRWENEDYHVAGTALMRLIATSSRGELASLSGQVEKRLEISLAELAADAHLQAALKRARGRSVQLQYVTEYEKPFLIPMLEEAYRQALEAEVTAPTAERSRERGPRLIPKQGPDSLAIRRPGEAPEAATGGGLRSGEPGGGTTVAGRRPAHGRGGHPGRDNPQSRGPDRDAADPGREAGAASMPAEASDAASTALAAPGARVIDWLDRVGEYDRTPAEAAAMAVQIYHASSLLNERMRLDPELRKNQALRAELTRDRVRLANLLKTVRARAGGSLTPQEREDMDRQRQIMMEEARRMMDARDQHTMRYLEEVRRTMENEERIRQGLPPLPAPPVAAPGVAPVAPPVEAVDPDHRDPEREDDR
jgi:hypothetical protein